MTASSIQSTDTRQERKTIKKLKQFLVSENLTREFLNITTFRLHRGHSSRLLANPYSASMDHHLLCGYNGGRQLL